MVSNVFEGFQVGRDKLALFHLQFLTIISFCTWRRIPLLIETGLSFFRLFQDKRLIGEVSVD